MVSKQIWSTLSPDDELSLAGNPQSLPSRKNQPAKCLPEPCDNDDDNSDDDNDHDDDDNDDDNVNDNNEDDEKCPHPPTIYLGCLPTTSQLVNHKLHTLPLLSMMMIMMMIIPMMVVMMIMTIKIPSLHYF